ncbi:ATP-dependent RNA helicase DHX30-like [Zerene cesonia]|uniref:ATP-dependent RNA helicase DHX30-like n=1 Tax=Zerene cesonia TaxID=33412 RepID=UPI0018E5A2EC|nr:ATP-dependent RNA helicase DHX30-like [Zerene cesonia]
MFLRRIFISKINNCRHLKLLGQSSSVNYNVKHENYSSIPYNQNVCTNKSNRIQRQRPTTYSYLVHAKYYSKHLSDSLLNEQKAPEDKELNKIRELFSQPRVTLNELASKTPDKIFDIYYKQATVAPKGSKKKVQQNDWTCTYTFVWPEKAKFEGTAISKRQAAEKSAVQALHWLYINRRINNKGEPIYDREVLDDLKSTLNNPIEASISDKSMQAVKKVWDQYENGIKSIYETTFDEAKQRSYNFPISVQKDSTLDENDGSEDLSIDNEQDVLSDFKKHVHPVFGKTLERPSSTALARRERNLEKIFQNYDESLTPLPIDQYAEQIATTLRNSRVVVIVGAAGCGKSTRVPAAILRDCGVGTTALVSEPRRVAAIGLAQRVADELGEGVGETVGYQVRLQSKPPRPPAGAILYCTSGVLLRRLQMNPGLEGCSHVMIDEAHERDVNTDITLLLLKRALNINRHLKIVVMSATLDIGVFTRYFGDCPLVEVPGRTYPVEDLYLDHLEKSFNLKFKSTKENCTKEDGKPQINCQEVVELITAIDKTRQEGAILVFLPGWAEIKQTKQLLDEVYKDGLHLILPIHSRLSTQDQTRMFNRPPAGVRKIVLSTNIAETSVTIPDVVHVVDTGAHKENRVRPGTGTASLDTTFAWAFPGFCYKMYTKEKESEFPPHSTPEILRIPLEQTVLDCKTYAPNESVESFLSELPQPPRKEAVRYAVTDLVDIGALSKSEQLTRLGTLVAQLNVPPRLARGVLHAAIVGNVVAACNMLAHCADNIEVFNNAGDRKEEIRNIKRKHSKTSDHAALHWIQEEFEQQLDDVGWRSVDGWCDKYGLRKDRLSFVKSLSNLHLGQILKCGILEASPDAEALNQFTNIDEYTPAILLSGTNALLLTRRRIKMTCCALLFSMGDVIKKENNEDITDLYLPRHRLTIQVPSSQADSIVKVKEMLWNTFQYYIERDVNSVSYEEFSLTAEFRTKLMKVVGRILVEANEEYVEKYIQDSDFR